MNWSIRTRLHLGASLVMLTFFCLAGLAVQNVYSEHLRQSHYARLQSTVYMLIAITELGTQGQLQLPAGIGEPQLAVPSSGLYAQIDNPERQERWQSPSSIQIGAFPAPALSTGQWQQQEITHQGQQYLSTAYQVRWVIGREGAEQKAQTLRFIVLEDTQRFSAQLGRFQTALWGWLGAAALCLLLAQALLLRWGLRPLQKLERELAAIEQGEQTQVAGSYPREIAPLAARLNRLVEQEHARQQRYREALGDLAHSLKTPLAILRADVSDEELRSHVKEQVSRMDHIVQHQLSRAALRGEATLAAPLPLKPVAERLIATMQKVHAARQLQFTLICADELQWPLDEGDAFEIIGNVLDNAGKWARSEVQLQLSASRSELKISVADDGAGFVDTTAPLQRGIRLDERVAGHGIGLSVVADIVQAYQGRIELGRSALGGASVTLLLPDPR